MNKTPDWFCAALAELNAVYQEKSADNSNPHSRGMADGLDIAESIFTKHANNTPTEQSVWISVEDALPTEGEAVLAWTGYSFDVTETISFHDEDGNLGVGLENDYATHWQPLPEPPRKA